MYLSALECKFQLFSLLMPIAVVAPLIIDDEESDLAQMYRCKYLFDTAVLRGRGLLKLDGQFVGNISVGQ